MTVSVDIPEGRWVVAVSGHGDSVALLRMAVEAVGSDRLVVVHLDHELRGAASTDDAEFVRGLAQQFGVRCVVAQIGQLPLRPLANKVAMYRAARHEVYRHAVVKHSATGVLLAHHANDQAETVALRMLRGVVPPGRLGMLPETTVDGLRLVRPLLWYTKQQLVVYLQTVGQGHRSDASNELPDQARNVLRKFLAGRTDLHAALLALHLANEAYRTALGRNVPALAPELSTRLLADLPDPVARVAAGSWLAGRGCYTEALSRQALDRLLAMCRDAATPARQMFPGGVTVWRNQGKIKAR